MIYIKNTDTIQHKWAGQYVQPSGYYLIENAELANWQNSSQLLTDIGNGVAIVAKSNDGTQDITDVNEAINYLKNNEYNVPFYEHDERYSTIDAVESMREIKVKKKKKRKVIDQIAASVILSSFMQNSKRIVLDINKYI